MATSTDLVWVELSRERTDRGEVMFAVAEDRFDLWEQTRIRLAAIEKRDLMSACESGVNEMSAKKTRAADDEKFH